LASGGRGEKGGESTPKGENSNGCILIRGSVKGKTLGKKKWSHRNIWEKRLPSSLTVPEGKRPGQIKEGGQSKKVDRGWRSGAALGKGGRAD